jgi:hypothetical protein
MFHFFPVRYLSEAKYQRPVCGLTGHYRRGLVLSETIIDKGNRCVAVGKGKITETTEKTDFRGGVVITQQGRLITNITVFVHRRTCMAECTEFIVMAIMQP